MKPGHDWLSEPQTQVHNRDLGLRFDFAYFWFQNEGSAWAHVGS
jgi:hypothetical protein